MRGPVAVPRRSRHVRVGTDGRGDIEVPYAGTFFRRLRGLLFGGDELILNPCSSVHGFGMRTALDVAYINSDGRVIDVATLTPWSAHRPRRNSKVVWEAPLGRFEQLGIVPGVQLRFAHV